MEVEVLAASVAAVLSALFLALAWSRSKSTEDYYAVWKHVPVDEDDWRARPISHYLDMAQQNGVEFIYVNEELPNGKPVLCAFFLGESAVEMAEDLDLMDLSTEATND